MHPFLEENRSLKIQLNSFEELINELATHINLSLTDYVIDHASLRTSSLKQAKQWLNSLTKYGKIVSNNIINQRPIYIIELTESINICKQKVSIIELPFPRGKKEQVEGWEHIEVVYPYQNPNKIGKEQIEQWQNLILQEYRANLSSIIIESELPRATGEELANPSISYKYFREDTHNTQSNGFVKKIDSTSHNNYCCIKIHPHSLIEVISSTII